MIDPIELLEKHVLYLTADEASNSVDMGGMRFTVTVNVNNVRTRFRCRTMMQIIDKILYLKSKES